MAGNGKYSSQSDQNYWSRMKTGKSPSNQASLFLHILRCEDVLIELTSKLSEVVSAKERISPRLNHTHGVLNPITGKVSLVTARNTN